MNKTIKWIFVLPLLPLSVSGQINVDTSFEGSNARILSINNSTNTVKIESKLRTGDIHNVVFYCKISGFSMSEPLKVQVKYSQQYYLPVLAAFSYDGLTWSRFTGTISGDSKEFTRFYTQSPVYFCYGYPYVYSDLLALAGRLTGNPHVTVTNIAASPGGRQVKLFKFTETCVPDSGKYLVWVVGRQHAMETHSNYVIEGLVDFLVSGDPAADRLRRRAIIYIVPVMDVDNSATGGTGKDQLPVDFNRDWDSPSYWAAVIAVKQKLSETAAQNPLKIFIDSHDPFPGSPGDNERLYFYSGYSSGPKSENLNFYRKLLLENGGYVFDRQPMYATNGQTASRYADSMYGSIDFSVSLETGWVNRTDNTQWTIPLYRNNGEVLGKGMNDYLSNIIRPGDLILDNTDTSGGVTITGQWFPSTSVPGFWGVNYIHDGNTGQGTKSVRFSPSVPAEGVYEIFLRWTQDPGRASNVPVRISYRNGVKDTVVSQRTRGAEWVSLGMYDLSAGSSGHVLIQTTGANGFVIADAVRFSRINNCNPIGIQNTGLPAEYSVSVYPNPFNQRTRILYRIPGYGLVSLKIFDLLGREVKQLVNGNKHPGNYSIEFDASGLSSGVYFYRLETGEKTDLKSSGKLVLVK